MTIETVKGIRSLAFIAGTLRQQFGATTRSFSEFHARLRNDQAAMERLAGSLNYSGLSPSSLNVPREEFFADQFLGFHKFVLWAQEGFNVFSASDSLIASLSLTDVENVADQIKFPFGTFVVSIPPGYISIGGFDGRPLSVKYLWLHQYSRSDRRRGSSAMRSRLVAKSREAAKAQCVVGIDENRKLLNRHVVRGHMKHQACGPHLAERKLIWIEPYWRGPDDGVGVAHFYRAAE